MVRRLLTGSHALRFPMYVRNVKQVLRQANGSFDERAYGFAGLMDLLRACQRDGVLRLERDRRGALRVFPGSQVSAPAGEAATGSRAVEGEVDEQVAGSPAPAPAGLPGITDVPAVPGGRRRRRGRVVRPHHGYDRRDAGPGRGRRNAGTPPQARRRGPEGPSAGSSDPEPTQRPAQAAPDILRPKLRK